MKTAISIPDPLFTAAERLAKRLGISRSELFQQAVRALLEEREDEQITEALDAVYGAGVDDGVLEPVLERLQAGSLQPEEW